MRGVRVIEAFKLNPADWTEENLQYEVNRLRSILRTPACVEPLRTITRQRLRDYESMLAQFSNRKDRRNAKR